jgi:hypothetical protein
MTPEQEEEYFSVDEEKILAEIKKEERDKLKK